MAPEIEAQRLIIESRTTDLQLLDGRNKHNNGWFVVRSLVPAGAASGSIDWVVTPHAIPGWKYRPVVHVSQVGYHPKQKKTAVIELDDADAGEDTVVVKRVAEDCGFEEALSGKAARGENFSATSTSNLGDWFERYHLAAKLKAKLRPLLIQKLIKEALDLDETHEFIEEWLDQEL